ncbi:MAG TPA: M14 family zinc carboxypeptidase [Chloroflexota bacterium]|nr:M14 family zinc carboxypeptidase [Chloroflexota bacterium]
MANPSEAQAQAPAPCRFVLGFALLRSLTPATVGDCLDDQQSAANGDAVQHTTHGLLVWRKADNFTAFTNGADTWVNGPFGLEQRPNDARFAWEANATHLALVQDAVVQTSTIGTSVEGRSITATRIGGGPIALAFVGDTHGAPEAATASLIQTAIAYFRTNPDAVPAGECAYFIPTLNPDGLADGTRFNADGIDINRNFGAADWNSNPYEPSGLVRGAGGQQPFSEPETRAMRDFLLTHHVVGSIFYHSPWGGLYAEPHSLAFAQQLGQASGYPVHVPGDTPYPLTGTAHAWADANGEYSVLLELRAGAGIEWQANFQAMAAAMRYVLARAS